MDAKRTTITIQRDTYDALKQLGHTGDSFDSVLRKLLKLPERQHHA